MIELEYSGWGYDMWGEDLWGSTDELGKFTDFVNEKVDGVSESAGLIFFEI